MLFAIDWEEGTAEECPRALVMHDHTAERTRSGVCAMLSLAGLTQAEIARVMMTSQATVSRLIADVGASEYTEACVRDSHRRAGHAPRPKAIDEGMARTIRAMVCYRLRISLGVKDADVAKVLGVSREYVNRLINGLDGSLRQAAERWQGRHLFDLLSRLEANEPGESVAA